MDSLQSFSRRSRQSRRVAAPAAIQIQRPHAGDGPFRTGDKSVSGFHQFTLTAVLFLTLIVMQPGAIARAADPAGGSELVALSSTNETDSFMGVPVGAPVRVKCTAPEIELNNARLLAVAEDSVTVATANGERYTLPKESTVIEAPVDWKRTSGFLQDPADKSRSSSSGSRGWFLIVLVLAVAGVAGGIFVARRRAAEGEESGPQPKTAVRPGASARIAPTPRPGTAARAEASSRIVLGSPTLMAAAPPPPTPAPRPEEGLDQIDQLIETRAYGTAIERLEQQIKLRPGEFKLRAQLLKVYAVIENAKQADRVLRQIEGHPSFSAEQKQEARQIFTPFKTKEHSVPQAAPAPKAPPPKAETPGATASKPAPPGAVSGDKVGAGTAAPGALAPAAHGPGKAATAVAAVPSEVGASAPTARPLPVAPKESATPAPKPA